MKAINEYINESKQIEYRVSFVDCMNTDGIPVDASVIIDAADKATFEKYLTDEQDNTFIHAEGGDIEY